MFLLDEKPLVIGNPFKTLDGTQYPANWLQLSTEEDRIAIGISEVPDNTVYYDDRFYWGADNPKDLDQCKANLTAQIKATAGSMLAPTDWKVIRATETGIPLDADTLTARANIRAASNTNEAAVAACTTVDELAALQLIWPE